MCYDNTLEARDVVMMTVADEGMDGVVGDAAVIAVRLRAGEATRINGFFAPTRAFDLPIGTNIPVLDDFQPHLIATLLTVMR